MGCGYECSCYYDDIYLGKKWEIIADFYQFTNDYKMFIMLFLGNNYYVCKENPIHGQYKILFKFHYC